MTTTDTQPRPLACPVWCDGTQHNPQWHDGALRVDHGRDFGSTPDWAVSVGQEAAFVPDGNGLSLAPGSGPAVLSEADAGSDGMTAAEARRLARALMDAAGSQCGTAR
ncbi:MAG: hypothetical protein L0G22_03550 [Propionibacteriaceae bacterium]|nr:hypothetical protein [Propionibacteriaceae bacterium]